MRILRIFPYFILFLALNFYNIKSPIVIKTMSKEMGINNNEISLNSTEKITGQYNIYLPLAVSQIVIEDPIMSRWAHNYGTSQIITYRFNPYLTSHHEDPWYAAYSISTLDWNGVPDHKLTYEYNQYGSVYLTTFFDDTSGADAGRTIGYTNNGYLDTVSCYVNTFLDYYSSNQKRSLTGHELGHGLGLGHILNPAPQVSLMGYNPDGNFYFVPQQLDKDLVNYIYQ